MNLSAAETLLGFYRLAGGYLAKSGNGSGGVPRSDLGAAEQALARFGDVVLQPDRVVYTAADVARLLTDLKRVSPSPYALWSGLLTDQPKEASELGVLLAAVALPLGVELVRGDPPQWFSDIVTTHGGHPWHFADSTALLTSALTIGDFGGALHWVELVGHEEMFDALKELKEVVEACLTQKYLQSRRSDTHRWFLSEVGTRALIHLARIDPAAAAPLLRELVMGEKRRFEGQILDPGHPLIFHTLVQATRGWNREMAEPILADWLASVEFTMGESHIRTMRVVGKRPDWELAVVGERVVSVREDLQTAIRQLGSAELVKPWMNRYVEQLVLSGDLTGLQAIEKILPDPFRDGLYHVASKYGHDLRHRLPSATPFLRFLAEFPIGALQTEAMEALALMYRGTKVLAAAQALAGLRTSTALLCLVRLASDPSLVNGDLSPLHNVLALTGSAEAEAYFMRRLSETSRWSRTVRRTLQTNLATVRANRETLAS